MSANLKILVKLVARLGGWVLASISLLLISACSSLLPSSQSSTKSVWPDFSSARAAYDKLETGKSTLVELKAEKFHPETNPSVITLSQTDIQRRFILPNMPLEYLDVGVKECLAALRQCAAYEVDIRHSNRQRVGNFVMDVATFKRETAVRGWRFSAVFLLKDGVLVYKTWGGQAEIAEDENVNNPLGPFQTVNPLNVIK
jgi:hypothetical protein